MVQIISLFMIALPFLVILILANLADRCRFLALDSSLALGEGGGNDPLLVRSRRYQAAAFAMLYGIYALFVAVGSVLTLATISPVIGGAISGWLAQYLSADGLAATGVVPDLLAGNVASPLLAGGGLLVSGLLGGLLLLHPVRRWAARLLPLDGQRAVHGVALSFVALVLANLLFTLGIGLGNVGDLISAEGIEASTFGEVWAQQLLWAFIGLVGVGWLTRRDLAASLQRLGLTRPTLQGVIVAVGLAISAVFGVILLQGMAMLVGLGPDPEVAELSQELIGPLTQSLAGVLTLGLAAAIGEETLLRGAVQPRFGLLATAVIFALLHSNYGITFSTLVVFLLGLLLGWVRRHYNTVTSMIVHALYNTSLGLLAYLAARLVS